jgi:signal transduction histidine kinase
VTTPHQIALDRLARLARRVLGVPVALITVIEPDRQRFIGMDGLDEPWATQRWTPISYSLCRYPAEWGTPLIIPDTRLETRVDTEAIREAVGVLAYAGVPLRSSDGEILGTFCAIDTDPREWTGDEVLILGDLAAAAAAELMLHGVLVDLKQARAYADATVDTVREPLLVLDHDRKVVSANRAFYRTFSVPPAEVIGRRLDQLGNGQWDDPALSEALGGVIGDGTPFENVRISHEFPRLGPRTFQLDARMLEADSTQGRRILVAMEDITARLEARHERQTFMDSLAHDLRNPVAAIRGEGQLLSRRAQRGALDVERIARGLDVIERSTGQMIQIIDEMVDTVYLDAGQPLDLRLETVDLGEFVAATVANMQAMSADRLVRTDVRQPVVVHADPARLRRVIDNVVGNAIKYSPGGGTVSVTIDRIQDRRGEGAVIEVADQGIGIPAVDLPHVFERFHRGSNVDGIYGSGIGLSGVQQLVEQHEGQISLTSIEGKGTCFTIWLPVAPGR